MVETASGTPLLLLTVSPGMISARNYAISPPRKQPPANRAGLIGSRCTLKPSRRRIGENSDVESANYNQRHSKFFAFSVSPCPFVLGVLRIRTQRAAAARKCLAGCDYRSRRSSFFDPVDHRTQKIELIKAGTSAAVRHAGNKIKLTPLGRRVEPAIVSRHFLVIPEGV